MRSNWKKLLGVLIIILFCSVGVPTKVEASEWSKWTTQKPKDNVETQKKTQYRYADKIETTSTEPNLSGWTKIGETTTYGNWGAWSGWTPNAITPSDTREVNTATVYGFYYFYCTNCGRNIRYPYWGYACEICGKKGYVTLSTGTVEWFTNTHASSIKWGNNSGKYYQYINGAHGRGIYWNWDGDGNARIGYRSRTRSKTVVYSYYKWGDWSKWTDNVQIATDNRKVEKRILYRTRHEHDYVSKIKSRATIEKNGKIKYTCKICDDTYTKKIYKIDKVKLSTSKYEYNGKKKTPNVIVEDSRGKTISSKYYDVKFSSGRKKIGTYKVTIEFKGRYKGTVKKYFKIVPKQMTLKTVSSPSRKRIKFTWKKDSNATGYEVRFSLYKNFKNETLHRYYDSKTTMKTIVGVDSKKTYYVKVRAYKKVDGKTYYGKWSKVKSVRIK